MTLFLATARMETIYSPGDDGMTKPKYENIVRLVEASNEAGAEYKLRGEIEQYVDFKISVVLDNVEISRVIR